MTTVKYMFLSMNNIGGRARRTHDVLEFMLILLKSIRVDGTRVIDQMTEKEKNWNCCGKSNGNQRHHRNEPTTNNPESTRNEMSTCGSSNFFIFPFASRKISKECVCVCARARQLEVCVCWTRIKMPTVWRKETCQSGLLCARCLLYSA